MIHGLLFDFDGLILDTETTEFISWQEIFRAHDCEIHRDLWCSFIGARWASFDPLQHLEEQLGRPVDRARIRPARDTRFRQLLDAEPARPGVRDCLVAARRLGMRTAVASSAPHAWVDPHLQRLGLTGCFTAVICAEDAAEPKPAPDLYLAALRALGFRPDQAVALEDSPNGILAARRAGLRCVAVPNPMTARLDLSGADLAIASLAEVPLPELLARLARPRVASAGDIR